MAAAAAVVEDVAASCRTAADAAADSSASSSRSDDPSSAAVASWGPFRAAFVLAAAAHSLLAVVLEAAFAACLDPSYSGRCRTWAGCPCPGNQAACCSYAAAFAGFASCPAVLAVVGRSSSVRYRLALACFDSSPSRAAAVVAAAVVETVLVDFDCVYSCFDVLLSFELAAEGAVDLAALAAGMDRCCSSSSFAEVVAGLAVDLVA